MGAREGEADEPVAIDAVEVGAGRERHPGRLEQGRAPGRRVVGQVADVGVEVEGAVGRGQPGQAGRGQTLEQRRPVAPVALDPRRELGAAGERRERRLLRQRRRRDEQILGEQLDRPHQVRRRHQPAEAPAGHAEVFGEAVDHDRIPVERQHARGRRRIGDAMVDLVGDQPDAAGAAVAREAGELAGPQHGPGRVGRARDHEAVDRRRDRGQLLDREREAGLRTEADPDRLDPERPQDVLVGREGGLRHDHPVAGIEGGKEAEDEGAGRADRDDHLRGIDLEVVGRAIVRGDRPAQRRPAERFGIAERDPAERPPGRFEHRRGRPAAGLADLQMDDVLTRGGALGRRRQHVHRDERRDPGPLCDLEPWRRGGLRHTYSGKGVTGSPFCHNRPASARDGRQAEGRHWMMLPFER